MWGFLGRERRIILLEAAGMKQEPNCVRHWLPYKTPLTQTEIQDLMMGSAWDHTAEVKIKRK